MIQPSSIVGMETLCRVCGSPGSYDVFGKIPRFLNTDRRDLWQQPISKMVSDVTGIPITKNDGLPERVCSLCISYLKHAVSFRNRAVQTRLSLLSAAFVTIKSPFDDFGIASDNNEDNDEGEKVIAQAAKQKKKTLEIQSPPPEESEIPAMGSHKLQRFFDYEEKSFVEDDMTKFEDGMYGIEINHPEVFKERKCSFCLKKFMLEESYDDHLDECLFRTLIEFVKDSNYIVRLKDEIAISNHEFIRRMVFAIQRVHKAIRGMQLPASATLTDEIPSEVSSRRSETPPGKPQPPMIAPKVLHFFQQQQSMRPPATPPMHYGARNYYPQQQQQFIPYHQPNLRTKEGNSFRHSNNFFANRSPQSFININTQNRNSYFNKRTNSVSSSRGSLQTPSPTSSDGSRRVVCKYCDKTFLTISHLDGHMIKEHT